MKVALLFTLTIGFFSILLLYSYCGDSMSYRGSGKYAGANGAPDALGAEEIDCDINGEYIIGCRKEGGEVYLPFSFLHKYFEVYGKLATYDGLERYDIYILGEQVLTRVSGLSGPIATARSTTQNRNTIRRACSCTSRITTSKYANESNASAP